MKSGFLCLGTLDLLLWEPVLCMEECVTASLDSLTTFPKHHYPLPFRENQNVSRHPKCLLGAGVWGSTPAENHWTKFSPTCTLTLRRDRNWLQEVALQRLELVFWAGSGQFSRTDHYLVRNFVSWCAENQNR